MFVRSTFDKAVCSEPLAFAADAGLWVLNGRNKYVAAGVEEVEGDRKTL
jgi:hypothetical protein